MIKWLETENKNDKNSSKFISVEFIVELIKNKK